MKELLNTRELLVYLDGELVEKVEVLRLSVNTDTGLFEGSLIEPGCGTSVIVQSWGTTDQGGFPVPVIRLVTG